MAKLLKKYNSSLNIVIVEFFGRFYFINILFNGLPKNIRNPPNIMHYGKFIS